MWRKTSNVAEFMRDQVESYVLKPRRNTDTFVNMY